MLLKGFKVQAMAAWTFSIFSSVSDLKKLNDRLKIEPTTSAAKQVELLDQTSERMFHQSISVFNQGIGFQKLPYSHDLNQQP